MTTHWKVFNRGEVNPKMKSDKQSEKVVGYVRTSVSPKARANLTIEEQKRRIREFCDGKGYQLIEVYGDIGYSGTCLRRPGIQELLVKVFSGDISKVVCPSLDRFSRSALDYIVLVSWLEKNGVKVVTTGK